MSKLDAAQKLWEERHVALEQALALETQHDEIWRLKKAINDALNNIARLKELIKAGVDAAEPPLPPALPVPSILPAPLDPTPRPPLEGRHLAQAGYALVIGVSKYAGDEKQKNANQFPNLSFAADDAREFHAVLEECGYKCSEPLLDERATLRGIMRAIDDLFKQCSQVTDPLVLIFFAGHGARDDQGRHYLVPHDGLRNELFATALWSMTLESALRIPQTDRLLLVVDACHAAAIEALGERGDFQACDPMALVSGKSKGPPYVLASCLANQVSRERDGHGIFSSELLQLMRFEAEEVSRDEELELFQVYNAIKQRVLAKAEGQEPWSNVIQETGIVLAINHERRKARTSLEWNALTQIAAELERLKFKQDELLLNVLHTSILEGLPIDDKERRLYKFFKQTVEEHRVLSNAQVQILCTKLIRNYWNVETQPRDDRSRDLPARPERTQDTVNVPRAPSGSVASRPVVHDSPATFVEKNVAPVAKQATELVSGTAGLSSPDASRRCLSGGDVDWVFEEFALFIVESSALEKLVSDPNGFRKKEFVHALQNAYETLKEKCETDESNKLVDQVRDRFRQAWGRAYKPGPWRFTMDEIKFECLLKRLSSQTRPVDVWLANHPDHGEERWADSAPLRRRVMVSINAIVHGSAVWDPARFEGIYLRQETLQLSSRALQGEQLQQLHRLLLEDSYPDAFERKRNAVAPLTTLLGRSHD